MSDCTIFNFVKNKATSGCAIYHECVDGSVFKCSFVNNFAIYGGGAIYWNCANGIVSNCGFVNNTVQYSVLSKYYGGAIDWIGYNGLIYNCQYTITCSGDSNYSSFTTNGSLNKSAHKVDPKITAKSLLT